MPLASPSDRRREGRRHRYLVALEHVERLRPQLRREIDHVVRNAEYVAGIAQPVRRERLGRGGLLARHVGLRHRPFLDRPHRLAGHTIEHIEEALLGGDRDRLDRPAIDVDVGEDRRRGDVEIPDRMVDELEMPLAHAGLEIDRDQALGIKIVARDDGRRRSPTTGFRPADRRGRAPHRRVICVHTPVLPLIAHELSSQVSLPVRPVSEWC